MSFASYGRHWLGCVKRYGVNPLAAAKPGASPATSLTLELLTSKQSVVDEDAANKRSRLPVRTFGGQSRRAPEPEMTRMPSRPGEFHPEPLTGPYVSVSTHTARATPKGCRLPPHRAPPVSRWPTNPGAGDLLPSLHGHYPASSLLQSSPPLTAEHLEQELGAVCE